MLTDTVRVITLHGDYDVYSSKELEATLASTIDLPHVVVDFSNVRYLDSTALSVLIRIRKRRAERGFGPKHFANMNASLRHIFQITSLDTIWPLFDDVESALAAF